MLDDYPIVQECPDCWGAVGYSAPIITMERAVMDPCTCKPLENADRRSSA